MMKPQKRIEQPVNPEKVFRERVMKLIEEYVKNDYKRYRSEAVKRGKRLAKHK